MDSRVNLQCFKDKFGKKVSMKNPHNDALNALRDGKEKPKHVSKLDWDRARKYAHWKGIIGPGAVLRKLAKESRGVN